MTNLVGEFLGTMVMIIFGKATLGHLAPGMGPYMVGLLVWGIGRASLEIVFVLICRSVI